MQITGHLHEFMRIFFIVIITIPNHQSLQVTVTDSLPACQKIIKNHSSVPIVQTWVSIDSSNFELRRAVQWQPRKSITCRVRIWIRIRIRVGDSCCCRLVLLQLANYRYEITCVQVLEWCYVHISKLWIFVNLAAFGHPDEVILCNPVTSFSSPWDIERCKRRMLRSPHGGVQMANCNSPNHRAILLGFQARLHNFSSGDMVTIVHLRREHQVMANHNMLPLNNRPFGKP